MAAADLKRFVLWAGAGIFLLTKAQVSLMPENDKAAEKSSSAHVFEKVLSVVASPSLQQPALSFKSTSVHLTGNLVEIKGMLTLYGVSKEVQFQASRIYDKNSEEILGSFLVNLDDFKSEKPVPESRRPDEKMLISFHTSFNLEKDSSVISCPVQTMVIKENRTETFHKEE